MYGDITIGPRLFSRHDLTRSSGMVYNKLTGWYDTTNKTKRNARQDSNGDFGVAKFLYTGLVVSVEGTFIAYDSAVVARAKSALKALKNNGEIISMSYEDGLGVTSRDVQVEQVRIPHTSDPFSFTWSIDVSSEDDLRYGPAYTDSTSPASGGSSGLVFPLGSGSAKVRTNLVGDPNTTNSGRWSWPTPAVTSVAIVGGKLRMIANGTATSYFYPTVQAGVPTVAGRYAINAGQRYTIRAEVTNSGTQTIWVALGASFYNSSGGGSGVTQVPGRTQLVAGQSMTLEYINVAADGASVTTGLLPLLYMYGSLAGAIPASGMQYDTTHWQLEIGDSSQTVGPLEFWTGDTSDAAGTTKRTRWAGTVNASPTTQTDYSGPYLDFGTPDGSTGRLQLTNLGDQDSWPEFVAMGGATGGLVITDVTTGQTLMLTRNIPAGQQVYFDSASATVFVENQTEVSADLDIDEWFVIPAGETHTIQFSVLGSAAGSPLLTGTVRPAY